MEKPLIKTSDLFTYKLVLAPLELRAETGQGKVNARLEFNEKVTINNEVFSSIEDAMNSIPRENNSTSSAWQFWSFYNEDRGAWTPLEHLRAYLETQQKPNEIKTSQTHPLRIDEVTVPGARGKIGLTFCPGKVCEGLYGGTWERDLHTDIEAIISWGGKTLISLMENHEFKILGVPDFPKVLTESEIDWIHLPIQDMQIPDASFEKTWSEIGPQIHEQLRKGDSIVIHCRGGLGRTGLLAARMLCDAGIEATEAVRKVRTARENAIETYAQEEYVLSQAWK